MSFYYQCTEEQILKLEILDAHLHVLQSLASATKDEYSLDLDNRKLSLMLWSVSNELSSTLDGIKAKDSQAKKPDFDGLKKALAAYQDAEESNHD